MSRSSLFLALAALCSGLLCAIMLRHGVLGSPDAWSYWEGSISLLEFGRYTRLQGAPLTEWPPLFSLYLALFQMIGSQTGCWLIVAMSFLVAAGVLVWGSYGLILFKNDHLPGQRRSFLFAVVFLSVFLLGCAQMLLAHLLFIVLLGVVLIGTCRLFDACNTRGFVLRAAWLGSALALLLLAHNTGLAYLLAIMLLVLCARRHSMPIRLGAALLVALLPLGFWLIIRYLLGQTGSHGVGNAQVVPWFHLGKSINAVGTFFLPVTPYLKWTRFLVGLGFGSGVAFLFIGSRRCQLTELERMLILFVLLSYLVLFVLFCVTFVHNPLGDRFLWYIPLTLVPVVFRVVPKRSFDVLCLFIALTAGPLYVAGQAVVNAAVPYLPATVESVPDIHIRPWYFLTDVHPSRCPANARVVIPPSYPWMHRWQESSLAPEERRSVRFLDKNRARGHQL